MATTFYKPLSCFEPSFERFATVSQDGRLKIFDTRSGGVQQQLAEKDHLSTQYTAIAWGATTFQGVGQTERSKRAKKQLGGAVAIGTAKGTIVVWDILRGEVHKELGGKEGHTGKVNDLVFTEGATFLFSCSDDLQVIKWNIENGEIVSKFKADNQPISSLALSADNSTLATASAMIKMWDLASSKSQKKFTGHTSAVTTLNFSANGKFLASASATERYTSVWDLEAAGNASAAAVFTATSNPVYVEFSKPKKAKAKTSLVLALLRSGSVGLWQFDRKADADAKPTSHKPDSVIKIVLGGEADSKKKKGKPGSVLFAQFTNEHEVLVAFGTTTKPIFERVNLLDEATGQLKKKITIRDESEAGGTLIEAESPRDKKPNVHSNLIGPTQVNSLVRAGVATEAKKPEPAAAKKEVTKAAAAKPKETLTLQEQLDRMQLVVTEEPDEEKEADDEETMEAQLSGALEREVKGLLSVWGGEDKKHHKLKSHQVAPKATSLASALAQAIHTKDRHLLEKVLNIGQEQIIFGTVTRLQQDHVLPFLQLVLARFRGNPNRSVNLLVWIRAVLVEHVAYLSTVPALLTSLSDLYSTVRTRLANHKRYVKLAGRLELLNAQIQERNERAEQSHDGVCFYHEDDDKGPKDNDEEGGVSLMDVMDMGDEDEQDMMDDEDDDDEDEEEIEDDGLEEEEEDDDDENENGDEPSGDEAGGEVDLDDDDEAASDDGEEDDEDDEEEEDEDN